MNKQYYVYILTNFNHNVLYIGVTGDLRKRTWQHREKVIDGFTKKYNINKLVYYETYEDVNVAIEREKQLKRWGRGKKETLIMTKNPEWKDLYEEILL